jgi:hypothetical protein
MATALALVPIGLAIAAAVVFIFVRRGLTPSVRLGLETRFVSDGIVALTIDVENVSQTRVLKDAIILRVQEHNLESGLDGYDAVCLGHEWVSLRSPWLVDTREVGAHCALGPVEIMETTVFLNPRETISVERLYVLGRSGCLHVGLQIRKRFPWYVELVDRLNRWLNRQLPRNRQTGLSRQQTATFYVVRNSSPGN